MEGHDEQGLMTEGGDFAAGTGAAGSTGAGILRRAAAGVATVLLSVAAMTIVFDLRHRDLSVPFGYGEDNMYSLTWIKALLDEGWWSSSPRLGAPGRMELGDFPQFPHLHFAVMKVLTLWTHDAATVMNLYFLIGFPLTALATLPALRALGIGYGLCIAGAVLYAFLPYHFVRGVWHLFLAGYFMVPLLFLIVIWLFQGKSFLVVHRDTGRLGLELRSVRAVVSLLICAALAFDFPYYSAFGCVFLAMAGVLGYYGGGGRPVLARAVLLTGALVVFFAIDLSPYLLFQLRYGPNPSPLLVANHPWEDAELFGLTVTQMLLPAAGHPVPAFRALRDKFYASTPIPSEEDAMALGAFGSVGLLLLLWSVAGRGRSVPRGRVYHLLGLLVVFAILLGTVGGFATLFNLLGTSLARTYNRLSIFVALPAVAATTVALDQLVRRPARLGVRAALGVAVPAAVLVFGLLDQTGKTYVHDPKVVKPDYDNDAEFFARAEATVPEGTMVYQLPYISYLSYANAVHGTRPYDHWRGFVHSRHLRWSFGATHGRYWDGVHAALADRPVPEAVRGMVLVGFGAVYVDRAGYPDGGRAVEDELARVTGSAPVVSRNGRMAFYDLGGYAGRLRASLAPEEWERERREICDAPRVYWGDGFDAEERLPGKSWRWCRKPWSQVVVTNPRPEPITVTLEFNVVTPVQEPAVLRLRSLARRRVPFTGAAPCSVRIEVPPGQHALRLECPVRPQHAPGRDIYFGVFDFQMRVDDGHPPGRANGRAAARTAVAASTGAPGHGLPAK